MQPEKKTEILPEQVWEGTFDKKRVTVIEVKFKINVGHCVTYVKEGVKETLESPVNLFTNNYTKLWE